MCWGTQKHNTKTYWPKIEFKKKKKNTHTHTMLHPPKVELQEIIKKKIKRESDRIIIFLRENARDNNKFIEN